MTQRDVSEMYQEDYERRHSEAEPFRNMLVNLESRYRAGDSIKINDSDHKEVKLLKQRVQTLLDQELEALNFEKKISQEEKERLATSSYTSIANKSSFFFNFDSEKKNKNLQVVDSKAPGNKHRHLNVILPHEHIHIQHLMDTSGLTKDKLYELYAWHQIMIDMHISKIRPENLEDLSYVPKHLQQVDPNANMYITATNKFFDHYHRFREPKNKYIPQTW